MEVKERERIVVAKPVPSRPRFRSFSELVVEAISSSPPNIGSETAVAAIRPTTVRFRPTVNLARQAEMVRTAVIAPTVVYKPLAKFVSKTTVSPLVNTDTKDNPAKASTDSPSYDGYNGRKYGQNQVKCTRPNCPVKNKIKMSLETEMTRLAAQVTCQVGANLSWNGINNVRNEESVGRSEHWKKVGLLAHSTYQGKLGECEEENDESKRKRRKSENQVNEASVSKKLARKSHISVKSSTDTEIIGDGFRWRKYGQKVVKGNPYPRSYYKCTSLKCNMRKHVERTSEDPKAFITKYEGKHNHGMPHRSTVAGVASDQDSQAGSQR